MGLRGEQETARQGTEVGEGVHHVLRASSQSEYRVDAQTNSRASAHGHTPINLNIGPSPLTTYTRHVIRLGFRPGELSCLAHQRLHQILRANSFCTGFSHPLDGPLVAEHLF